MLQTMLAYTFLFAALLTGLTVKAWLQGDAADGQSLLFFAGAVTICAFFALKSRRHGFVGATVVALLLVFTASYLMLAHGTWRKHQREKAQEFFERESR